MASVWDRLEDNPVPRITHETVATFFPSDAPQFYTIPYSQHDRRCSAAFWTHAGRAVQSERIDDLPSASVPTRLAG